MRRELGPARSTVLAVRGKATAMRFDRMNDQGATTSTRIIPFLRWIGGKQNLIRRLLPFVPPDYQQRCYREPFLGAGSMFLALRPKRARLADANQHLIRCYEAVRDNPRCLIRYLRDHAAKDCPDHYYTVREDYNRRSPSTAQAARFLYLNRTCFNGVFRVNTRGEFNVPYAYKHHPIFPDRDDLGTVSHVLRNAKLVAADYQDSLAAAEPRDFLYLDPPYPPLNGTSYFTHYTKERFDSDDQIALAESVCTLNKRGCLFMMSNADIPLIRRLYRGFNMFRLSVTRFITCRATKHCVSELVITNYKVAKGHLRGL